ncbi:MAG: hypothetical protein ACO271_14985, partial [Burkholderiales bacterium]
SAIRATTDIPVVVRGDCGKGRVVYFANTMEALYYHYGFPDLAHLMANAVRWTAGAAPALEVEAPDYVDVTQMGQPGRSLVHLINLPLDKPLNTGWRHPGRNLVPVHDIVVRLRPPAGQRIAEVRLASNENRLQTTMQNGACAITVPALSDHEIVVFEFEKE